MRPLSLLFLLFLLLGCTPAQARPRVEVAVIDRDEGRMVAQYPHRGERWIAGLPGHRYAVRLTNTTGERVLVVLSVDGINAVTGETAHPAQTGYVLDPWETAEISGWRKSLEDVAQFVFTDHADSYATRTGRPRNAGVIGIAVFAERAHEVYSPATAREESAQDAAAAAPRSGSAKSERANAHSQRLGTGHGEREWSPVGSTAFERASRQPVQISEIRYDAPRRLIALGILPGRPRYPADAPRAFPQGFVADPPR